MERNNPFELSELPRRVMPLIFIVDTSGSMDGAKIGQVNNAVRETLTEVGEISKNNKDAQIKIAALRFSSNAEWMYSQLQDSETFKWQDLVAEGMTNLGAAFSELNKKLSKDEDGFMAEPSGMRAPAMILLSDGMPTDEYHHALEKLKGNNWFNVGVKIAIRIGDEEAKVSTLAEFTGDKEAVITVHNREQLKNMIKTVTITTSMLTSRHSSLSSSNSASKPANLQSQVVENLTTAIQNNPDFKDVDQGDNTTNAGTNDWADKW